MVVEAWTLGQAILVGGGIALVLFVNGCLVACEFALVKVRYNSDLFTALGSFRSRKFVGPLISKANETARLLRFAKVVSLLLLALLILQGVRQVAFVVFNVSAMSGLAVGGIALFLSLFFFVVLADLPARGIALQQPLVVLKFTLPVVAMMSLTLSPALQFFRKVKEGVFSLLGFEGGDPINPLDVEVQIRALGEDDAIRSKIARSIINRTLAMQDLVVADILLPRNQVLIFDLEDSLEENLELAKKTGHTRFPLCAGDLDHCIGLIHIKDLFRYRGAQETLDLARLSRPIIHFQEEEPLDRVLQRMLRMKMHMALVRDEFGGILGVITLEKILEVLVGEIQDEFDSEDEPIRKLGPDRFLISGLAGVHDVEQALAIRVEDEEIATFGGLITSELGEIPSVGTRVSFHQMDVIVKEVEERRIISAMVTRLPDPSPDGEES